MKKIFIVLSIIAIGLSSCKKDKVDRFSVVYEVEFISEWSNTSHPTDFPNNAHFSPYVAISHIPNYFAFIEGFEASDGVKDIAETGATSQYLNEIEVDMNVGYVLDYAEGNSFDSPGNSGRYQLGLKEGHHYVTALSMIAPSPDWFVATRTNLFDAVNGRWYDEVISHVASYDAGTDSGLTFTSSDEVSSPQEFITFIEEGPLTEGQDTVVNMGYFKFTRIK